MNPLFVATAAGMSLGLVIGYRAGTAVVRRVAGEFSRSPIVIGLVIAGVIGFLIPATLFVVFAMQNLGGEPAAAVRSGSLGAMLMIVLGIGVIIGSGVVVAVFAGALCGRFAELWRTGQQ